MRYNVYDFLNVPPQESLLMIDLKRLANVIALRHTLHQFPEISGEEHATAKRIATWLENCAPTKIIKNLGGPGIVAIFDSGKSGPSVLFRCELDALPIQETGQHQWRSTSDGKAHLCGHDGHMAILAGLALQLKDNSPQSGKVMLAFQPAEETGQGARAMIADPAFAQVKPDFCFALHNLPNMEMHQIGMKAGPFNFASEGLKIKLEGRTAHAAQPENGLSPASAMTKLVDHLPKLPEQLGFDHDSALVTLVHASLGTADFGIAPGDATIMATLRSVNDDVQHHIMSAARTLAADLAKQYGLNLTLSHHDQFAACHNNAEASQIMAQAIARLGFNHTLIEKPFRWSEDFGIFSSIAKSCMIVLGAGNQVSNLHNPDYDFPDELIETGIVLFEAIAQDLCKQS